MGFETQPLQAWRQQFEEVLGTLGCWLVEWRVARPVDGQWRWRIHAAIRRIRTDADKAACFPLLSMKEEPRVVIHEFDERVQRARDGAREAGFKLVPRMCHLQAWKCEQNGTRGQRWLQRGCGSESNWVGRVAGLPWLSYKPV